tara:strand:- start:4734 stop:5222 length:489 start_codon:yes stop_codon:yes gene_type:complete
MSYKQTNNPLSRKTSPLLRTSPLKEVKPIELETVDLGTIKSTNPRPPVRSVVDDVTSTILELQGNQPSASEVIKPIAPKADTSVLETDLGQKAMASSAAAGDESLSDVDRNIAERRSRRQLARAQRKELRKNMPRGKERRQKIKETRKIQGKRPENMVSTKK